jgi:RimJ/RimL family protein N-acetyltransferase
MLDEALPLSTRFPDPLTLRRLSTADAAAFADHVAQDVEHLGEHLPWPNVADTPDGAAEWLALYERGEDGRVIVAGAWSGDALLGGALLLHYSEAHGNIEIGCWAVSAAEGRGVASAACLELIALARHELGVERVEWRTTTVNWRSRRLAEKLGFRLDGTMRSDCVLHGTRYDSHVLSLVGEEIDQAIARG